MGTRKNPWTAIGYSTYKGFHRMPFELRSRAQAHDLDRQRVVSSILLELYVMATLGIIKKHRNVSVKKAISQNLRGSRSNMTEAAHCCPRQVMVGDQTPQGLLKTVFPERSLAVNGLFAESNILPANFNKCDSRAEGNGLSKGFRDACQYVVKDAHLRGKMRYESVTPTVRNAFYIFKNAGKDAYRVSVERLENKLRFNATEKEKEAWTEQIEILQIYSRTLRTSSGASVVLGRERVNGILKIYNEI